MRSLPCLAILFLMLAPGCETKTVDEDDDELGGNPYGDAYSDADTDSDADADADADADTDSDADTDADSDGDDIEIAGTWNDIHDDIHVITDTTWSYTGYTDTIIEYSNDEDWVISSSTGQYYRTRWIWESDTRWYWCVTAVDTSLTTLEDYGPIDPDNLDSGCAGDIWAPMDEISD